ncbi:hypothetical protein J437_LFUL013807 [Ladona fulva]|uniref:Uncharacterized protein n=1 Tax=Ladona fulva TaxID=123851 RepID=A0A8K0KIB8_LADFU|nr:hypothetical protein J437_LFUL013807 [Ladona fulva]
MMPPGAGPHPPFQQHGPPISTSIPGNLNSGNTYEYPMYSVAGVPGSNPSQSMPPPQQMQGIPGHPIMPGPRGLSGQGPMITVGQTLPGHTQTIAMAQSNQSIPVGQPMPVGHNMPVGQPMLVGQAMPIGQPIHGSVQTMPHGQPMAGSGHPIPGQPVASHPIPAPHFTGMPPSQDAQPQASQQLQHDAGQQQSSQQTAELISFD